MGTWRPSRSSLWAADRVESWVQAAGRQATQGVSSLPIDTREEGQREPEPRSCPIHVWGPVGDRLGAFQGRPWTYPPDFRPARGPMFHLHPRPHCPVPDAWMDTLPKSSPKDAAQEAPPRWPSPGPPLVSHPGTESSLVRASALPRPETPLSPDKRVDEWGGDGRSSAERSDQVLAQRVRPC